MKRLVIATITGLAALSFAASANACGYGKVAGEVSKPVTTAMDAHPVTPKPADAKSGS